VEAILNAPPADLAVSREWGNAVSPGRTVGEAQALTDRVEARLTPCVPMHERGVTAFAVDAGRVKIASHLVRSRRVCVVRHQASP